MGAKRGIRISSDDRMPVVCASRHATGFKTTETAVMRGEHIS